VVYAVDVYPSVCPSVRPSVQKGEMQDHANNAVQ